MSCSPVDICTVHQRPPRTQPGANYSCRLLGFSFKRSPLLGILSGASAGVLLICAVIRSTLFPEQLVTSRQGSVSAAVLLPLSLTCFTGAYGMRGLRLVILSDSKIRERWGKFAKHRAMAKSLVILFVIIEAITWAASLVVGVDRWAGQCVLTTCA